MTPLTGAVSVSTVVAATIPSVWTVDKVHSSVTFTVSHLVISEVEGSFKVYDGTLTAPDDLSDAEVTFEVDVNSINTDMEARDNHLRSDDFFAAARYPKMSFRSISWTKLTGNTYALAGELTIRDITRRVTFDVRHGGTAKDGYGNVKSGFKARTTIDRMAFGLRWNMLTEAGGMTVGKDVTIELNLQFTRQPQS